MLRNNVILEQIISSQYLVITEDENGIAEPWFVANREDLDHILDILPLFEGCRLQVFPIIISSAILTKEK